MFLNAFRTFCVLAALVVSGGVPAAASSPFMAVDLPEVDHGDTVLTVVSPDGSETFLDLDALESLPTYRLETTTPWRDTPAAFDGVQLRHLLAETGLDEVSSILVTAENDFTSVIPREVWETLPVLVATRVNGAPISRRERGPILFVIEADAYKASDIALEAHLVWMAARIQPDG